MSSFIIKTENLTKYYSAVCGIENVNLQIKQGELFGFLGFFELGVKVFYKA